MELKSKVAFVLAYGLRAGLCATTEPLMSVFQLMPES